MLTEVPILTRDLITELISHLTVEELKNLCITNREYWTLCQSERFQKMVRAK